MEANYTYSRAEDDVTDYNSDFEAFDQTNLRAERAVSAFDQRHKLVISGVFESPSKNVFLKDFSLSPVLSGNSGHPFNIIAGTDVNGDRHSTDDRYINVPRNTGIGPDFWSV